MEGRPVMAGSSTGLTTEQMDCRESQHRDGGVSHTALLYRDADEYRRYLSEFARAAALDGAALQVVLPEAVAELPRRACVQDMTQAGLNPARLIASARSFADQHPNQPIYCAWEPAWPGRTLGEQREVGRHEALCNLAFRDEAMTVLCLYDISRLDPELIGQAELTHPTVISAGRVYASPAYLGAGSLPGWCDEPLSRPPAGAATLFFTDNLAAVRKFATRCASAAGLAHSRVQDLVLAVNEIASNSYSYAGSGVIRAWASAGEIICQIEDTGYIADPLAGRRQRPADALGGHGLWLVNLVCDLVERRTNPGGTMTRLCMRVPG